MAATVIFDSVANPVAPVGQSFILTGHYTNPPFMADKVDSGSFAQIAAGNFPPVQIPFSYLHAPISTAGAHNLTIEIGVGGPTAQIAVNIGVASAGVTLHSSVSANPIAGSPMSVVATLQNASVVPTLYYILDNNGTHVAMTGVTLFGATNTLTAPAAGSHTITIYDSTDSLQDTVSFSTAAVVTLGMTSSVSSSPVAGNNMTSTVALSGFTTAPTDVTYKVDSNPPIAVTVTTSGATVTFPAPSPSGSHSVTWSSPSNNLTSITSFTDAAAETINITMSPNPPTANGTATITVAVANDTVVPVLTYQLNGQGTPVAITGETLGGATFTLAVPNSTSLNTLTVTDTNTGGRTGTLNFNPVAAQPTQVVITPTNGLTISTPQGVMSMQTVAMGAGIIVGGTVLSGSGQSAAATYVNGFVYGQDANSPFHWFQWDGANFNDTGSATTPGGGVTPPPPTGSALTVTSAGLKDSNGNVVKLRGTNLYSSSLSAAVGNAAGGTFVAQLPKNNAVRIVCFGDNSHTFTAADAQPAAMATYINRLTSLGVYCFIDGHSFPQIGSVCTGAALTAEANWYKACGSYFANNPRVGFFTNNEPVQGDGSSFNDESQVTAEHVAIYNAIRSVNPNCLIFVTTIAGGDEFALGANNPVGLTPDSAYSNMSNCIWDLHYYAGSVVDPELKTALTRMVGETAQIHFNYGVPLVAIGEYGPSQVALTLDPGGTQDLNDVHAAVDSGLVCGCFAWSWTEDPDGSNPDGMLDGSGNLNARFGQVVRNWQNTH